MKKTSWYAVILNAVCAFFLGCSFAGEESAPTEGVPVRVENLRIDNYFVQGKNVQIFTEVPKRVLVVGDNETETLIELGAASSILLAAANNDGPFPMKEENARILETLPRAMNQQLHMEYVMQARPDLIIGNQYCFTRNSLGSTDYWNAHGVKTLVNLSSSQPRRHYIKETVAQEMESIRDYGRIFHAESAAEHIVQETYDSIDEINEKAQGYPKPRVMLIELMSTFVSYDKSKLAGNMAEQIGAEAIETPAVITFEHIAKEDPDVLMVICSHAEYGVCLQQIYEHPGLQHTKCVQNRRIYSIPLSYTYGPLCHTINGIKMMAKAFYPGIAIE